MVTPEEEDNIVVSSETSTTIAVPIKEYRPQQIVGMLNVYKEIGAYEK